VHRKILSHTKRAEYFTEFHLRQKMTEVTTMKHGREASVQPTKAQLLASTVGGDAIEADGAGGGAAADGAGSRPSEGSRPSSHAGSRKSLPSGAAAKSQSQSKAKRRWNKGTPHPELPARQLVVEAFQFLMVLLHHFKHVPEDIVAELKTKDDGTGMYMLQRLQEAEEAKEEKHEMENALVVMKQELNLLDVKLKRLARLEEQAASDGKAGSQRTELFLARNERFYKVQEVQDTEAKLVAVEHFAEQTWADVIAHQGQIGASHQKAGEGDDDEEEEEGEGGAGGGAGGGAAKKTKKTKQRYERRVQRVERDLLAADRTRRVSRGLKRALQMYLAWVARQHEEYLLQFKAVNALQKTWKQKMEELAQRSAVTIQRAYRARIVSRRGKEEAMPLVEAKRAERKRRADERRRREAVLAARGRRDMDKHHERMGAKNKRQREAEEHAQARQAKLVRRHRDQEAERRGRVCDQQMLRRWVKCVSVVRVSLTSRCRTGGWRAGGCSCAWSSSGAAPSPAHWPAASRAGAATRCCFARTCAPPAPSRPPREDAFRGSARRGFGGSGPRWRPRSWRTCCASPATSARPC
jgi:hypothetical protein